MSMKQTISVGLMAVGLLLSGCRESGMQANQDEAQIPAGTQLYVRVNQSSSGSPYKAGDEFHGTLERAIELNGRAIVPAGTMVSGEFTNDLGDRMRSTDINRNDGQTSGTAADSGDATIAGRDKSGDTRSSVDKDRRRDDRAGTMADRDQLGVELNKMILNGEEYTIDTEPVPVPGTAASSSAGKHGSESMGSAAPMTSSMIFTLSDNVEIPTNLAKSE